MSTPTAEEILADVRRDTADEAIGTRLAQRLATALAEVERLRMLINRASKPWLG